MDRILDLNFAGWPPRDVPGYVFLGDAVHDICAAIVPGFWPHYTQLTAEDAVEATNRIRTAVSDGTLSVGAIDGGTFAPVCGTAVSCEAASDLYIEAAGLNSYCESLHRGAR